MPSSPSDYTYAPPISSPLAPLSTNIYGTRPRHSNYMNPHEPDAKNKSEANTTTIPPQAVNPSSDAEQERNFLAIYEPKERAWEMRNPKAWDNGPKGSVGSHSLVETPFNCEYGYNIHLGNEVLIQQNCTMQDASIIYIGDRTIVGPNVKFYCLTTSVDAQQRKGSRGEFQAGPIRVEEDVVIHADCVILPFRTIGKGAVVGAGSVVTRVSTHRNRDAHRATANLTTSYRTSSHILSLLEIPRSPYENERLSRVPMRIDIVMRYRNKTRRC